MKEDEKFIETAVDPARRDAAVRDLTQRRSLMLWCAIGTSLAVILTSFGGSGVSALLCLVAAIQWILLFRIESDLKLLKVIERLQKDDKQ